MRKSRISTLLVMVLLTSLLFVSCDKLIKKNDEVVEIKAEKVITKEADKVISAVQEIKQEPEVTIIADVQETVEEVGETVEEKVAAVEETIVETVETAVETVEETIEKTVEETIAETAEAVEETVVEVVTPIEENVEETVVEVVTAVEETLVEPIVEAVKEAAPVESVKEEKEVYNPPVKAKEIPVKESDGSALRMEIGAGVGYYRLEYSTYKADMLKVSIPVYIDYATSDKFAVSMYVKPGYLKELQKDATSSAITIDSKVKKQDFCFICGLGVKSSTQKFSVRANFGLDIFNPGTKIDDPYGMINMQVIPSFRLGDSKLWISIPFEGSISPKDKHNRAYGTGIYITLRTEEN